MTAAYALYRRSRAYQDLSIEEQRQAGLPKSSIVKVGKIVTLDQRLIRKQLGRMPETGRQQLIHMAMTIFGAA